MKRKRGVAIGAVVAVAAAASVYGVSSSSASGTHVPCVTGDATVTISKVVRQAPDGATVRLTAGCTYTTDDIVQITHPVTFDGNGATLQGVKPWKPAACSAGAGSCPEWWIRFSNPINRPHVAVANTKNVTVRNVHIRGVNVGGAYDRRYEDQPGVLVFNSQGVSLEGVRIAATYGDGIELREASNVSAVSTVITLAGRQGFSSWDANTVSLVNTTINSANRSCIDLEDGFTNHFVAYDVKVNKCGNLFLAATAQSHGLDISDVTASAMPLYARIQGPGPVTLINWKSKWGADPSFGLISIDSVVAGGLHIHGIREPVVNRSAAVACTHCPAPHDLSNNNFSPDPRALWFALGP